MSESLYDTVADRSEYRGKRGKDPEVIIPIKSTPDVTAMTGSNMATRGSDSGENKTEKSTEKQEESPTSPLIWLMNQWLEKRRKEVEMIDSFLKRGFDWPS